MRACRADLLAGVRALASLTIVVFVLVGSSARAVEAVEAVAVDVVAPQFASVGDTFVVDLTLSAVEGLDTAQFSVSYDAAAVAPVASAAVLGSGFPENGGVAFTAVPGGDGLVVVNFLGIAGVAGVGPLVRLPFRGLTRGSTVLGLSAVLLGDGGGRTIPTAIGQPIVVDIDVAPAFEQRAHWVFDPAPGGNGDGIASPGERVYPRIRLKNVGGASARGVRVRYTARHPAVRASGLESDTDTWPSGSARNGDTLVMDVAPDAAPDDVTIVVDISADNGGPWQYTVVLPIAYPHVFFQLRNDWIFDPAPGGNKDGVANPGERLEPRVRLKNVGDQAARNVRVTLSVETSAIALLADTVSHDSWPAGEARNNDGLLLEVSPDAAPTSVHARVRVEADNGGPWVFDIPIAVVDLPPDFSFRSSWEFDPDGNRDGVANPGERVRPRIRLRNDGPGVGRNVRVSLTVADPVATVVASWVHHATWRSGVARNNDGFVMDVASGAVSGVVTAIVEVSADTGGPWVFTTDIPIVAPIVEFALRSTWVFDPAPGGNKNGIADAGEDVFPRVRLRNHGSHAAEEVRVSLSSSDRDIIVVVDGVSHTSWAAGAAGNNEGFVVAVAPGATSHDAHLTVHVEARSGGPWDFPITLPVAAAPVLERRSFWVRDKTTGDGDGDVNPGETVELRARLRNTGGVPARNVVVTLAAADPTVVITENAVAHATWPAGDARNNAGLAIQVGVNASGDVALTLIVTADNGGPWRFTHTIAVVPKPRFVFRQAWPRDKATGDGDGLAEPGERVQIRARIKNEGDIPAEAVMVTLRAIGPGATVVVGAVAHGVWPAGEGRNNVGLLVDLADDVGSSVEFALDVTAANAGPWRFPFTVNTAGAGAPAAPTAAPTSSARVGPTGSSVVDATGSASIEGPDRVRPALAPDASALLPNYPNPFNPETWIPFDLARPSRVTVAIYGMDGRRVRLLDLGWRDAGRYRTRADAAYWDGATHTGDLAASGVYICELRAGDQRDMRRMVIRK